MFYITSVRDTKSTNKAFLNLSAIMIFIMCITVFMAANAYASKVVSKNDFNRSLAFWANSDSIEIAKGNEIIRIIDKSAYGHDASVLRRDGAPVLFGAGGIAVMQFDGEDSMFAPFKGMARQGNTIAIVYKANGGGEKQYLIDGGHSIMLEGGKIIASAGKQVISGDVDEAQTHVVVSKFYYRKSELRIDGIKVDSGSVGSGSLSGVTIGSDSDEKNGFSGEIKEVMVFTSSLDGDEIQDIEEYLADKWDVRIGEDETDTGIDVEGASGEDAGSAGGVVDDGDGAPGTIGGVGASGDLKKPRDERGGERGDEEPEVTAERTRAAERGDMSSTDITPGSGGDVGPGDKIVSVKMHNNTNVTQNSGFVTFGHVFKKGDWPANKGLVAKTIDGNDVAVQADVKVRHEDGSVKHAIITALVPTIDEGDIERISLYRGTAPVGAPLTADDIIDSGYNLSLHIDFPNSESVQISAEDVLLQSVSDGTATTWLEGPLVTEIAVNKPINTQLTAQFHIRYFLNGTTRTDVIVERSKSFTPGNILNEKYSARIRQGGETKVTYNDIEHHHHAAWHKNVWHGAKTDLYTSYDVAYMKGTYAIPQIDGSLGVKESTLVSLANIFDDPKFDLPMHDGDLEHWMPAPGGRKDIGPLNEPNLKWLVTQDPRTKKASDLMCDGGASFPMNFRDEAYDEDGDGMGDHIQVTKRGNVWLDYRDYWYPDDADTLGDEYHPAEGTGLTPEVAHMPSLCYLPYMISGDLYKLEQMHAQISWMIGSYAPPYRLNERGLYFHKNAEERARAWFMARLMNSEFITPDDHVQKEYLTYVLNENLDMAVDYYVNGNLPQADNFNFGTDQEGYTLFHSAYPGELGWGSSWQNGYVQQVFGWLARRGEERARAFLEWGAKFPIASVLDSGHPFTMPVIYHMYSYEEGPTYDSGYYYETWEEIAQVNIEQGQIDPNATDIPGAGIAEWYGGISSYVLREITSLFLEPNGTNELGMRALEAAIFMIGHQSEMTDPEADWGYSYRAQNTTQLTINNTDIALANQVSGTELDDDLDYLESNEPQLIHGQEGDDLVYGGGGVDVVAGGAGNDTVEGGAGDDYVFGNQGDDLIMGGTGNDILKGGEGSDIFKFVEGDGHDVIVDFRVTSDFLQTPTVSEMQVTAEGLLLKFLGGDTILLKGVSEIPNGRFIN